MACMELRAAAISCTSPHYAGSMRQVGCPRVDPVKKSPPRRAKWQSSLWDLASSSATWTGRQVPDALDRFVISIITPELPSILNGTVACAEIASHKVKLCACKSCADAAVREPVGGRIIVIVSQPWLDMCQTTDLESCVSDVVWPDHKGRNVQIVINLAKIDYSVVPCFALPLIDWLLGREQS